MKNIIFLLILFTSVKQVFSVNNQLNKNEQTNEIIVDERINKIILEFKKIGCLNENAEISNIIIPEAAGQAQEIIFVQDGELSKVIKTYKRSEYFKNDRATLEKDLEFICDFNNKMSNININIPKIIVSYGAIEDVDNNIYAVIQEKSKGKELALMDVLSIDDINIIKIFKSIGESFGNLDHLLVGNNMPLLYHPDGNGYNLLYDNMEQQLYWIDAANIAAHSTNIFNNAKMTGDNDVFFSLKKLIFFECLKKPLDSWNYGFCNEQLNWLVYCMTLEEEKRNVLLSAYCTTLEEVEEVKSESERIKRFRPDLSEILVNQIKHMLLSNQKFAIMLKSFGEGYLSAHPEAKSAYNYEIKKSRLYKDIQASNIIRDIIEEPHEPIIDLLIP